MTLLIRDRQELFLATIAEGNSVGDLVDSTLAGVVVATGPSVRILRINAGITSLAVSAEVAVRAVDGVQEGIEAKHVSVIRQTPVIVVVIGKQGDGLRVYNRIC